MATLKTRSSTTRTSDSLTQKTRNQRSLLLFQLHHQAYGIPIGQVQEVLPMAQISRPPNSPAMLAGFLNLGGKAIPVLRLDWLLGLAEHPIGLYTPLIVLHDPDYHFALMVEKILRICSIPDEAFLPVEDKNSLNGCIRGVATHTEQSILLLSPRRILFEKEQQCLAEFQDREHARLRELEVSIL